MNAETATVTNLPATAPIQSRYGRQRLTTRK